MFDGPEMRNKIITARGLALLAVVAMLGLIAFLPAPRAAEFPREGVTGIANGVAEPFAGSWWVGFPEGEGMINGDPVVRCERPVVLRIIDEVNLLYASPSGTTVQFELHEFSGRTTWYPPSGESSIAVWTGPDEFFAYSVDLMTGSARWTTPLVYRRCD